MSPRSCTSPRPSTPKIESTASRGAVVTSSPTGSLSTRQPGGKRSITKRFTHRSCREVRPAFMARPRWAEAYRAVSSCLVARGLIGHFDKESTGPRSWLKMYGRVCGNQSFYRRTTQGAHATPCAPSLGGAAPGRVRRARRRGGRGTAAGCRPPATAAINPRGRFRMARRAGPAPPEGWVPVPRDDARTGPVDALSPGAARAPGGGRYVGVRGNRHCQTGPVSGMLRKKPHAPGTARATEEWGRTLGGKGWGR